MCSADFERIVAHLVDGQVEELNRHLRNAVRAGDHHQAALCEGRLQAVEMIPASLKRLAERYKAHSPDRER